MRPTPKRFLTPGGDRQPVYDPSTIGRAGYGRCQIRDFYSKPLDLLGMGHVDDRPLAAMDPAAHAQPSALERRGGDALAAEQAQRLGREAQAERGAPVGAKVDKQLALDERGVGDLAFDDLEAAGIAPGLTGLAHGIT